MKLHTVVFRHVQCKPRRIDLCRLDALITHQVLQPLQRNARIEHVHGVAVPEGMRRYRHGEPDSVTGDSIIQPGTNRPVGHRPEPYHLDPARLRITSLKRNFQRRNHHLQLGHILRI